MTNQGSPLPRGSSVWAYLRVSGPEQQERGTIVSQREFMENWGRDHGLVITRWFVDEAKPGSDVVKRDDFNQMIYQAHQVEPKPAAIILFSWSRFARDEDDAHFFKADLRRLGIEVISATDDVPVEDRGMRYIIESLIHWKDAQRLKDQAKAIKRGLHTIAKLGYAPGGFPPRGYKAEEMEIQLGDGKRKVRRWVPDPEYWDRVGLAWQMKREGHSDREIHRKTRIFKNMGCYCSMWTNKTYLGIRKCGELEVPDAHTARIDQETWDIVQSRRRKVSPKAKDPHDHPRRRASPYLLSGLVYCGYCKAPMNGGVDRHQGRRVGWVFYRCSTKERRGAEACAKAKKTGARALESAIIEKLKESMTDEHVTRLVEEANAALSQETDDAEKTIKGLKKELRSLERKIQNLIEGLEVGGLREEISKRIEERQHEKAQVLSRLAQLEAGQPEVPNLTKDQIVAYLEGLHEALSQGGMEGRKYLRRMVQRIEVYRDYGVLTYSFPLEDGGTEGAPSRIRTCDTWFRKPLLYPD